VSLCVWHLDAPSTASTPAQLFMVLLTYRHYYALPAYFSAVVLSSMLPG